VAAQGQARLASSVHLVCRPRENPDGSLRDSEFGDWRDVLAELPRRIHEWMPRLAEEGVVGADAIFSCLGPALEIFSRYSRVEKVNGDVVPLREYLEHVWAAVSNEALSMIFKDADAAGLEPDARLTAMWLWTLGTASPTKNGNGPAEEDAEEESGEDDEAGAKPATTSGFVLEFDAARKIAQGLGIHLDKSPSIVEVKGDKARLLPVAERTKYLFGIEAVDAPTTKKKPKKKDTQLSLFEALQEVADDAETVETPELKAPQAGSTVLDRVHQAMILFAAGRGEALKRFLVEEGIGKDARFWKLAQSLSALYPPGIDEKRWVDGVLARKKGLGL
jgi:putative DNA methylase